MGQAWKVRRWRLWAAEGRCWLEEYGVERILARLAEALRLASMAVVLTVSSWAAPVAVAVTREHGRRGVETRSGRAGAA